MLNPRKLDQWVETIQKTLFIHAMKVDDTVILSFSQSLLLLALP